MSFATQSVSRFDHHEPCPSCGSKDNLGVWEDGHKYCFGCKHYEPPERTLRNVQRPQEPLGTVVSANSHKYGLVLTEVIPPRAQIWLKAYGITGLEMHEYEIQYDHTRDYLVFPLDETVSCRYFGDKAGMPKSITYGARAHEYTYGVSEPSRTLVIVEDCVSAIKVGRQYETLPILGSDVPAFTLKWASARFDRVLLWLDRDMAVKSVQTASKAALFYGKPCTAVITEKDPKEYSDQQIAEILGNFVPHISH